MNKKQALMALTHLFIAFRDACEYHDYFARLDQASMRRAQQTVCVIMGGLSTWRQLLLESGFSPIPDAWLTANPVGLPVEFDDYDGRRAIRLKLEDPDTIRCITDQFGAAIMKLKHEPDELALGTTEDWPEDENQNICATVREKTRLLNRHSQAMIEEFQRRKQEAKARLEPSEDTAQGEAPEDAINKPKKAEVNVPDKPKEYLLGWANILGAIGMKNDRSTQRSIKRLNDLNEGPIISGGCGKSPKVERTKLLAWHAALEAQWADKQNQAAGKKLDAQAKHNYGRDGTVVPEIGGGVKNRRSDFKR